MDLYLIGQLSGWLDVSWWWAVFQVVIGLGAVIFVHELGHFLVAKACGVKCEKFYVGFDAFDIKIGDRVIVPRKLVHWQWGETEYGVGILPLGGYVKMLGQDDNPAKMAEERQRALSSDAQPSEGPKLDPRSYLAKTVPQRMAIISAGVIMNLIFAVIFAAIAFRQGVFYEPPRVGTTIPGSPAWQNNLDGSQVLRINDQVPSEKYYTFHHLKETIVLDGYDGPLDLVIQRPTEDEPVELSVMPASNLIGVMGGENLLALGINPSVAPQLSEIATVDSQASKRAEPPLQANDRITAVDGAPVSDEFDLKRILARAADRAVELTVLRGSEKEQTELKVDLPANSMRTLGLVMQVGPIRAIRKDSSAARDGLRVGDKIMSIDEQPLGDPFTLQSRMLHLARAGQSATFRVSRYVDGATEPTELDVDVTPQLPNALSMVHSKNGIAIESLGINLPIKNVVAQVSQPASDSENPLQPGDVLVGATIRLNDRQRAISYLAPLTKPIDLKTFPESWGVVHTNLQSVDPGTPVELRFERDATTKTALVKAQLAEGQYQEVRGIGLKFRQEFYQDDSLWAAIGTGFRQTVYDASRVLKFLKKLFRGQLSIKHFGGPATIAVVATSEANQGTSRLLLFLTLLSANLAIINFLPIPVLDGGHMVFLMYEGIFRRPVGEKLQLALTLVGFAFLLALMVTVIGLDIWRLS